MEKPVNHRKTALVLAPMPCEYDALFTALSPKTEKRVGDLTYYVSDYQGLTVILSPTLIGTVNATVAATAGILTFSPDFVIIEGTAGAHDNALKTGDLLICERAVETGNFSCPRREKGEGSRPEDWQPLGEEMYVNGEVVRKKELFADGNLLSVAKRTAFPSPVYFGTAASGDIWNRELDRIAYFRETFGTSVEDMETFAVYQASRRLGVPAIGIRVVSNSEPQGEAFSEKAAKVAQDFTLAFLAEAGKE